ncbi:hypothetical protein GCM10023198_42390 [Promicromonospora umidemergens]|uniref:SMODS and SLOG-associating 2TM effector domain-containing protein n=1 Tax=Promicromonospora umidemergens TaxID=629679 RepID=A0ABP8XVA1_9MICO
MSDQGRIVADRAGVQTLGLGPTSPLATTARGVRWWDPAGVSADRRFRANAFLLERVRPYFSSNGTPGPEWESYLDSRRAAIRLAWRREIGRYGIWAPLAFLSTCGAVVLAMQPDWALFGGLIAFGCFAIAAFYVNQMKRVDAEFRAASIKLLDLAELAPLWAALSERERRSIKRHSEVGGIVRMLGNALLGPLADMPFDED